MDVETGQVQTVPNRTGRDDGAGSRATFLVAAVLSLAAVIAAQIWQAGQQPPPGLLETRPLTGFIAGPLEWLAVIATIGTVGSLLAAAWGYRHPQRGKPWKLTDREYAILATARRWATLWAITAIVLIPVNAADTNGVPLSYVFGSFGDYLTSTQTAQAWLLTAAAALAIAIGCWLSTTWRWTIGMTVLALLASLPTVVTAQVSVGAGHDLATDSAIILTLATTLWFGATWSGGRTAAAIGNRTTLHRLQWIGSIAVVVALAARLWIGVFELAGKAPLSDPYGIGVIVILGLLVVLAIRIGLRWRRLRGDGELPRLYGNVVDIALIVILLGVQTSLLRLIPPRFLVPQTPTENYLGYNLPNPPQLSEALLPGRPNLLLLVVSLLMIGLYLWGVVRLHRSGDRWPVNRTLCWILGWLMVIVLIGSRMWTYSSATFSWHMVVHMTLNMGAPVLLVLGGPVTLLLRTSKARGAGEPVGIHDVISKLLNWKLVQNLMHPMLVWVIFVGSLYVLYFTPLFGLMMRYHWAHQLMAVHFLIIGYLFYWLVIGIDRPPRTLPHIAKLGYIFAAMPFHAFFAVAVLSGGAIIGENFYVSLNLPWLTDLAAQQRAGGQVTWATGEVPLFIVIVALVGQWFRQDQRDARRQDRAQDLGHDDSLQAYNEMLAALSARDRALAAHEKQAEDPTSEPRS
ncbi:cytochrome c oxidase assembly protein [Microlunatus elymi]|uniref:Cytochrome c oxidase assembly protein n=1 Tax=Microlunatus elymi TaxID=2596828 RepID=A0A516PV46_9ACTN|nr:cytochrome c oxidase assembly protein [Microlunatus elymi]QDP95068.1 cytochrome c oxidase assembly protein [Microlunatus elymi]